MRVFKRTIKAADGRKTKTASWYGKVRVAPGRWQSVVLCTDKAASVEQLSKLQKAADRRQQGLLTADMEHARRPLSEHLAEFHADPARQELDVRHQQLVKAQLERMVNIGQWKRLTDITSDRVAKVVAELKAVSVSEATINRYTSAVKAFVHWCIKRGRLQSDPLLGISKVRESRKPQRALSDDEIAALLNAAPQDRCMVYMFAILTGLRRSELAELRWDDIHADAIPPYIQLRAEQTKNGKADQLPLHPDLVELCKGVMAHPDAKVFKTIPRIGTDQHIGTFRRDLKAAGLSEDIHFHQLRHTAIQKWIKAGLPMKVVQQLARHSTPSLTANVYGVLGLADVGSRLDSVVMPVLHQTVKTGTDDANFHAPLMHQNSRFSVRFGAQQGIGSGSALAMAHGEQRPVNIDESRCYQGSGEHYPQPDSNRCMQTENLLS